MKEKREKRLEMRLTIEEYQMIAQAAKEDNQTMALWGARAFGFYYLVKCQRRDY